MLPSLILDLVTLLQFLQQIFKHISLPLWTLAQRQHMASCQVTLLFALVLAATSLNKRNWPDLRYTKSHRSGGHPASSGQHMSTTLLANLRCHSPAGDKLVRAGVKEQQAADVHRAAVGDRCHAPQFCPRLLKDSYRRRAGQSREGAVRGKREREGGRCSSCVT